MREKLNRDNLKSAYPPGSLVAFQSPGLEPPLGVTHFRTADGTWNNLSDPKEGAAGTRFHRNVANEAIRPDSGGTLLDPNPRIISRRLLSRGEKMKDFLKDLNSVSEPMETWAVLAERVRDALCQGAQCLAQVAS